MRTGRNLLAGVLGSLLTTLVGLAVIPFYLSHLGIEAYGVIGFFVTAQALLQLLDMGVAPTVNREIARLTASNAIPEARKLLRTLEVINWSAATLIAVVILALAELVSAHWLQSQTLTSSTLSNSVRLMALVIAFRWPVAMYQAALIGLQRLDLASGLGAAMTIVGNLGAVAVLTYVSPRLEVFFLWQIAMALIYMLVMRGMAWKLLGREPKTRFDVASLRRVWRFSAGLSGIAVSALILTQLDKVLLSRILALPNFGHYMLATTIAGGFSAVLFTPAFNLVYPLFSGLIARGDTPALERSYRFGTRLLVTVLFPMAMFVALMSHDLLKIWTGNVEVAAGVAPLLTLLAIGAALHGVMYFPYALQLASGMTALPLRINAILLTVMIPLIMYLAPTYGAVGGALAWVILNALYVPLGTWMTHRTLLKGLATRWLFVDVGIPALFALFIGGLGHVVLQRLGDHVMPRVAFGVACAVALAFVSVLVSPSILIEIERRARRSQATTTHP